MAEHYSFFDAVQLPDGTFEPEYNAQQFTNYFEALVNTGILKGDGEDLKLTLETGTMKTILGTGTAYINGRYYNNDAPLELTHETEVVGKDRIDRVVIRMNLDVNARYVKAFIKKGVASTSPVPPALVQTDNLYEISVAQVRIVGGQTFLQQNAVTDERGRTGIAPWASSKILPNFDDNALKDHIENHVVHATFVQLTEISPNVWGATVPSITAYENGMIITFQAPMANTGPVQLNINGLGPKSLVGQGMSNSWIMPNGALFKNSVYTAIYNGNGFYLQSSVGDLKRHMEDISLHTPFDIAISLGGNVLRVAPNTLEKTYLNGMSIAFSPNTTVTNPNGLLLTFAGTTDSTPNRPILKSNLKPLTEVLINMVYTVRYYNGNFILQGEGGGQPGNLETGLAITHLTLSDSTGNDYTQLDNGGYMHLLFPQQTGTTNKSVIVYNGNGALQNSYNFPSARYLSGNFIRKDEIQMGSDNTNQSVQLWNPNGTLKKEYSTLTLFRAIAVVFPYGNNDADALYIAQPITTNGLFGLYRQNAALVTNLNLNASFGGTSVRQLDEGVYMVNTTTDCVILYYRENKWTARKVAYSKLSRMLFDLGTRVGQEFSF